jgi:hypothetical protein
LRCKGPTSSSPLICFEMSNLSVGTVRFSFMNDIELKGGAYT